MSNNNDDNGYKWEALAICTFFVCGAAVLIVGFLTGSINP